MRYLPGQTLVIESSCAMRICGYAASTRTIGAEAAMTRSPPARSPTTTLSRSRHRLSGADYLAGATYTRPVFRRWALHFGLRQRSPPLAFLFYTTRALHPT